MARRFQFSLRLLLWLTAVVAFQAAAAARRASTEPLSSLERIASLVIAGALAVAGLVLLLSPRRPAMARLPAKTGQPDGAVGGDVHE